MESVIIRKMIDSDLEAVQAVLKSAFYRPGKSQGFNEWNFIVDVLKDSGYVSELSLVAELNDKVVGYILLTKAVIGQYNGLALGPIAVDPEYQSIGIGSELVNVGVKKAGDFGYRWIALTGGEYYLRFGFESAEVEGIILSEDNPENKYLKIRYIEDEARGSVSGIMKFCDSFYNENGELL